MKSEKNSIVVTNQYTHLVSEKPIGDHISLRLPNGNCSTVLLANPTANRASFIQKGRYLNCSSKTQTEPQNFQLFPIKDDELGSHKRKTESSSINALFTNRRPYNCSFANPTVVQFWIGKIRVICINKYWRYYL